MLALVLLNRAVSQFLLPYFVLIATTGFILAAIDAGMIPASTPTIRQIETASVSVCMEMVMGNGITALKTLVSAKTSIRPIRPPSRQRKALSRRNSVSIVEL